MREAQDSASEPIAYSRVTKGGLPNLKPGTVDHIMKPPRPHRGVGTTQHRPAARPPQWHRARAREAGTTAAMRQHNHRRARTATATPRHRPQPAARRAGRRPAEPVLSLPRPPPGGPRTTASTTERRRPHTHDTKHKRRRMPAPGSANHPNRVPPTHNKAGTPTPSRLHQVQIRQCKNIDRNTKQQLHEHFCWLLPYVTFYFFFCFKSNIFTKRNKNENSRTFYD